MPAAAFPPCLVGCQMGSRAFLRAVSRAGGFGQVNEHAIISSMMGYRLTAALLGLSLAVFIVYLLRRDQLYLREAMFWLVTAVISVLFAVMPSAVDWLGSLAGVAYPPALILALVCAILTVKSLLADVAQTQLRREVRRLNQRVALMDVERQSPPVQSATNDQ